MYSQQITIIAGPTASGKSAEAVRRAKKVGGVVLNADALQLYEALPILSAQPMEAEMEGVPHRLFGVLTHQEQASAGIWLALAQREIDAAMEAGWPVVVVGGTGLYLKALLEGLSPIPEVPEAVVQPIRELDAAALYPMLEARDPVMAARLEPGDTQRITRALAVLEHSGTSLAHWQAQPKQALYPRKYFHVVRLEIDREVLYARCEARFAAMLEAGALEEVAHLRGLEIAPEHTLLKAVGVPELLGYLEERWTQEEAVAKAQQHTRNYAKRQLTWLKHQLEADEVCVVEAIV